MYIYIYGLVITLRRQWSFRKTGTMGTPASQAEIGVWVQPSGASHRDTWGGPGVSPPEKNVRLYVKSCNLVHFGWEMVRNAVHDAFLNTLKTGTLCVPAAFQQWHQRSHEFPLKMTQNASRTLKRRSQTYKKLFKHVAKKRTINAVEMIMLTLVRFLKVLTKMQRIGLIFSDNYSGWLMVLIIRGPKPVGVHSCSHSCWPWYSVPRCCTLRVLRISMLLLHRSLTSSSPFPVWSSWLIWIFNYSKHSKRPSAQQPWHNSLL